MADQQRWFKFWCSAPSDDHLQRLSVPDRWAWIVLGAYTKTHGTRGTVVISPSNVALAGEMGIPVTELVTTVSRLPHVSVTENGHGELSVTWHNWVKYQEDTTQAARQRTSRAKKRREKEEKKSSTEGTSGPPFPPVENRLPPVVVSLLHSPKEADVLWTKIRSRGPEVKPP